MAAIAKQCFLIFLLTLLFSLQIQARESQFFNKVPSNNGEKETQVTVPNNEETLNNKQQEQVQEPNFVPENENGGYGLYGHESGQFPPTTTTTADLPYNTEQRESYPKYLPKNYNTESYVTEAEGYRGGFENNRNSEGYKEAEFDNNKNANFYNSENSYYNEQQGLGETKLAGKSYNYNNNNGHTDTNTYYNGEQQGMSDTRFTTNNNYYNGEAQGLSDTRFYSNNNNKKNYYNHNVGNLNGVEKQGMSDTRFLENGKYFYDMSMEQNFNRGPYESKNSRGVFGNPENSNEFNNNNSYEQNNQEEQFQNFQEEEDLP